MPLNKENIISSFNTYFEQNTNFTRKELVEFAKKAYDENLIKAKKNIEKKPLNSYQLFMKEQRIVLNKRENEKPVEEKKKSTELMKEIAEMWKNQKPRIERKEMFIDDAKLNEKNLNISNDDEDNEATIITNNKNNCNEDEEEIRVKTNVKSKNISLSN